MKLIPRNHVQLFRDLLALAEKYNVRFYDSEYDSCYLTVDGIDYCWQIEDKKVIVSFSGYNKKAESLAREAFADEFKIVTGPTLDGTVIYLNTGVSYDATIEIIKDDAREFAHCSAFIGIEPPYTRETRTKELK